MTAQDSSDGKIHSLNGTVFAQRLYGILAASGGEPTGRRSKRGDELLIEPNEQYQHPGQHLRQRAEYL